MKHEAMMEMSGSELDDYARIMGIDVTGKKTVARKVEEIERMRGRTASVDALGMSFEIPVKRMHDKRVSDLISRKPMTDADAEELLGLLLGDEQTALLVERATDADGTVDVDAVGLAMARILGADDLKNF